MRQRKNTAPSHIIVNAGSHCGCYAVTITNISIFGPGFTLSGIAIGTILNTGDSLKQRRDTSVVNPSCGLTASCCSISSAEFPGRAAGLKIHPFSH